MTAIQDGGFRITETPKPSAVTDERRRLWHEDAALYRRCCPVPDCTICVVTAILTEASRKLAEVSHALTESGRRADGPDHALDAAIDVVSRAITEQLASWLIDAPTDDMPSYVPAWEDN